MQIAVARPAYFELPILGGLPVSVVDITRTGQIYDATSTKLEPCIAALDYLKQTEALDVADERKNQGRLDKTRMADQTDGLDGATIDALVASDPDQIKVLTALNIRRSTDRLFAEAPRDIFA